MMSQLRGMGYQKNLKASALKTVVTLISQQIERWVRPSEAQAEEAKKTVGGGIKAALSRVAVK
jgi:hypothetical protein